MQKIGIYPFKSDWLSFVRNQKWMTSKFLITEIYSPCGLGLVGKDVSFSCNHPEIGILVKDIQLLEKAEIDLLVLSDVNGEEDFWDNKFKKATQKFLEQNKKILYLSLSTEVIPSSIKELQKNFGNQMSIEQLQQEEAKFDMEYRKIQAPVIYFGGLVQEADILETVLQFLKCASADGYRCTVFTNHVLGRLFNFHCLTGDFNQSVEETQKISHIQRKIAQIDLEENPDLILIESPDAWMAYNDIAPNGYGIRTYMLSMAAKPDSLIGTLPFELLVEPFIEQISGFCQSKFDAPLDGVHIGNVIVDSIEVLQSHKVTLLYTPQEMVKPRIPPNSKFIIQNVIQEGILKIYEHVLAQLTDV